MIDALIQTQIFYEIAMSMGNKPELGEMLKESLSAYLRKLNCSAGVVLEMRRAADNAQEFVPVFSIPRNVDNIAACRAALGHIPERLHDSDIPVFLQTLPIQGQDEDGRYYYLMDLPGYGLLLLVRSRSLTPAFLKSMKPLNAKLANVCLSCLQNEKLDVTNRRLIREISERKVIELELKRVLAELEIRIEERTRKLKESNEELLSVNQRLNDIIDFLPDATAVLDMDKKVIAWNRAMEEMTGVGKKEMIGKGDHECTIPFYGERRPHLIDLIDTHDEEIESKYEHFTRKRGILSVETYVPKVFGGAGAYVYGTAAPLFDARGKRWGAIESIRDITERKAALTKLEERERRLGAISDSAQDAIIMLDNLGAITLWNPAAERMFGYSAAEALGKNAHTLLAPQHYLDAHLAAFSEFKKTGQGQAVGRTLELVAVRKNGEEFPIELSLSAFQMHGCWHAAGIVRDITERKKAEQALSDSEQRLQRIIQGFPIPAMVIGKDHRVVYWNRGWEELSQISAADVIGTKEHWKTFYDHERPCLADLLVDEVSHEEILKWHEGECSKSDLLDEAYEVTGFFPRLGREGKWLRLTAALIRNSLGVAAGAIETVEDITERKLAAKKLERSEEKFSKAFRASPAAIFLSSLKYGRFIDVNESFLKHSGYTREEVVGRSSLELGLWGADARNYVLGVLKKEGKVRDLEFNFRIKSGDLRTGNLSAEVIEIEGEPCALVIANDITERKRTENELKESQQKLADIIDFLPDATFVIDAEGKVITWNRAIEEMTGIKAPDMLGKGNYEYALPFYGERRPILIDLALERCPEIEQRYDILDKTETVISAETYTPALRGGKVFLFGKASALFDSRGNIAGAIESIRDITKQKRAEEEKERLQAQLLQAQKLEAVGTLAGGIAHDFNNILAPIIGWAEMALMKLPKTDSARLGQEQILAAALRAKDLVKQILAFGRPGGDLQLKPVEISPIVKEALKLLRASLPSSIEISHHIQGGVANADPTQIHQILMNLCTNAAHAMGDKGILRVELSRVDLSERDLAVQPVVGLEPGPYLKLCVSDTGIGMDQTTLERIFDPFFTTKEVGKGSGLGLSVVSGIVKQHRGAITVQSAPGRGSTFNIYIPTIEVSATEDIETEKPLQKGTERILLLDDEQILVQMATGVLEGLGYSITAETESQRALEVFKAGPAEFDLVITDYTMPKMTGLDLALAIRKIRPGIPIIICTGFNEKMIDHRSDELGVEVLLKPYSIKELSDTVRMVLGLKGAADS